MSNGIGHLQTTAVESAAASVTRALDDCKIHLLLAASGSVATIKLPLIIAGLRGYRNLSMRLILTECATQFLVGQSTEQPTLETIKYMPNVDGVYLDHDEWATPWVRGESILHIELRRWAHLLVIAPLSANSLAKIAGGFCDNLLTSVVRAWDTRAPTRDKPRIVVAPAMNNFMWAHPVTARHVQVLADEWAFKASADVPLDETSEDDSVQAGTGWFEVLLPQTKTLACGDTGQGGMCDWQDIVAVVVDRLSLTTVGVGAG